MIHECDYHPPSSSCYQRHKCRCEGCKREQSRYAKHRRVRNAQGLNDLVDAQPARLHVLRLMEMGMTHGTIAINAGMVNSGLQSLLGIKINGNRTKRLHRRTAARILAVTYTPAIGTTFTDPTGTQRRLQDLALRGFSSIELSKLCGVQYHTLTEVRAGKRSLVRLTTAEAVAALHRRLEGLAPTHTSESGQISVIGAAKRAGYAPLAAFDDVDDANERPKGVAA